MGKEGETVTVLAALRTSAPAATTTAKMEEHDDDDHVAVATGMLIRLGSRGKSRLPITKDRRRKYGKRSDDDVNNTTAAAAKAEDAEDSNATAADKHLGSNITEAKDIQGEDGGPKEDTSSTGSRSNNNRLLAPPANPEAVLPCLPHGHFHHHLHHHKPNHSFKSPTAQFEHLERAPKIPLSTEPSGHAAAAAASHPAAVPSPPAKVVATASAPTSTVYCNPRDGRSCTVKRGAIYGNIAEAAATASQARKRVKTLKERAAMTAADVKATAADFMAAVTAYTASVAAGGPDGAQRPASSSSSHTQPPPEDTSALDVPTTTLASTVSDSSTESAASLRHTSEVAKAEMARLKRRRLNESYGRAVDPIVEMRAAAATAQQVSAPGGAASISRTVSPPPALLPPLAVPQVHCVVPTLPSQQQEGKKRERGEGSSSSKDEPRQAQLRLAQHIGDASTCALIIRPNDILVHPPSSDPSDRAAAKAAFHRVPNRRFRVTVEWNLGMYFNPALVPSHRADGVRQRTVTELVKSLGTSVPPVRFLRRRRRRIGGGCSSEQDGVGGREVGGGKEEGDGSYEVMSKDSVLEYVHETFFRAGKALGYVTKANAAATAAAPPATAAASLTSSLPSSLAESSTAMASNSSAVEDVPVEASALAHPQPCAKTGTVLQGLHVRQQQQQQHHQCPPLPALSAAADATAGHRSASDEGKKEEEDNVAVAAAALLSQQRSHPPPLESCNSGEVFLPGRRSIRFVVKDEVQADTGVAEASVSTSPSPANKSSLRGVGIGVSVGVDRRREDMLRVAAQAQMQLQVHERAPHPSHPKVQGQAQPRATPQAAPQADNRVGMPTKRLLTEHLAKIQSIEKELAALRAAAAAAVTRQAVTAKEGGRQALAQIEAQNQCHAAYAASPAESTTAITVAGAPTVSPAAPAATRMPIVPRRNDVLVVRGAIPPNHVGNRRFRILIECNLRSYIRAAKSSSSSSSAPANGPVPATKEECNANATTAAQKGADKRRRLKVIERMVCAMQSCRGDGARFLHMSGSMWTEMRTANIATVVDRTFRECAKSYRGRRMGGWTALTLDAPYADDMREGRSVMGASVAATTTVARLPSVAAAGCAASASPAEATTAAAQEDGEKAPRPNGKKEGARNPECPPTEESAIVSSTSLDQQSDSCSPKSYQSTTLPVFPPNVERLQRDAQQRLLRNRATVVREHEMKVTLGPSSFAATTAAAAVSPRSAPSKEEQKLAEEEVAHPATAAAEKKAVPKREKFDQLLIRISDKERELHAALQEERLASGAAFGALNVTAPATAVPLAEVPLAGMAAGAGGAVAAPFTASPVQVGMDEIRAHARQLMQQQMSPKEAAATMVGPHQQESSKPVAKGSAADLVVPGAAATAVSVALEKQIATEQLGINELKAQAKELLHQRELLRMRQFQQRQVLEGALLKARQHAQLQLHAAQHAELELHNYVRHMCRIAAVDGTSPGSRAFSPSMSSLELQAKALQQAAEGPPDGQLMWKALASPRKGAQINGGVLPDEIPSALSSTDGSSEISANKSVSFREAAWGQSGSHRLPARRVSFQAEDESPSPGVGMMAEDERKQSASSSLSSPAPSLLVATATASSSAPDEEQQPCHIVQRGDDQRGLFTKKVDLVNVTRTGVKDQYDDCNKDGEIQVPGRSQRLCAPAEKSRQSLQGNDLLDVIGGMMMMKNQSKRDITANSLGSSMLHLM